ncbi:terminus macrodomain insulation protein YfbV [Conservatibacter flavescens]|uniref:UPF0208 membrane protein CVP05_00975 n=1 Tax=Conservatibacter flavescens TaxID=28161 RepID=A0A2M8S5H2_9PAST|nr:terminus macrodomain insulation protein YfbV [Conservatibacter flavescens]PJG86415.1 hypothetical protein CVP05_00975 [Conservatibacter flavescens]
MSIVRIFKDGQQYLNTWPLESKLGIIFPENRIIKATQFAQKTMPFLAVFALVWQQFYSIGMVSTSAAVLTALFALLLPMQGLYWLGKRANTPLSPQSAVWFYEIIQKLQQVNVFLPPVKDVPTYQHLAEVLKKAQQKLDRTFWQEV